MTGKKLSNRIPAEEVEGYRAWDLPPIHGEGVVPSVGREASRQREEQARRRGEKVEDVDDYSGQTGGPSAEEMQRIVEAAEKEGREQGYRDGFEQGRAEGYEAGEQKGREAMGQKLTAEQQRFAHMVQSLREPLAEQEDALEQWLLETVCVLSRSLVKRELLTDSSQILEQVRAAVAALPAGADHITLYLNPDDLALVEAYAEEHQLNWSFRSDEQLLPGGCRVATRESQVDFSVEHRLAQQLEAFVHRQFGAEAPVGDEPTPGDESISRSEGEKDPPGGQE